MTTTCVVQARFNSSRLPGKVLEPIGGIPMLARVLARLARSRSIDDIVVATTTDPSDDVVFEVSREAGFAVLRGSQFDVLDRFNDVLGAFPATDVVVRVTADCPFIDPDIVDLVVMTLREEHRDFVANRLPPPFERTYPVGLDVEACRASALARAWKEATEPYQREHVMPFIYDTPGRFDVRILQLDEDLSRFRWTVDTPRDLVAARELDQLLGSEPFGWNDVLAVARSNPAIAAINAHEIQKPLDVTDHRWREGSTR